MNEIINIHGAAQILSEKYGRTISPDYIRQLRKYGKLKAINEPQTKEEKGKTRAYLFLRTDIEEIQIGHARIKGVRRPRKRVSRQPQNSSETAP